MLGLGAAGYVAGTFHLMNHAFFKALLFLGAGSVIIAMHHEQDMWAMGGLKEHMPVTYYTFLAGSLALAGIVPFSGFWSKDEVLYEALVHGLGGSPLLLVAYAFGLVAVFFTGFYTFRMVLLTFHGEPRTDTAADPEPVGPSVKLPLVVLGVLAATSGLVNMVPLNVEFLHDYLDGEAAVALATDAHHYGELVHDVAGVSAAELTPFAPAAVSLGLALAGAGTAWKLYAVPEPEPVTDRLGSVKTLLANNYYQDEYQVWLAEGVTLPLARALDAFDRAVVDGVVDGVSGVSLISGERIRRLQTGVVSNYAGLITAGLVLLLVVFGLMGGWF